MPLLFKEFTIMRRLFLFLGLIIFTFLAIVTCVDTANNPFSADKAGISLLLKSSNYQESDTAVTDTVGKVVRLGVCLYLTQHIDSTIVTVGQSATDIDTALFCKEPGNQIDTVYYDLLFKNPGDRTVTAIAYVGKNLRQALAKIHIVDRPVPNRAPKFSADTVLLTGHPGVPVSLTLADRCSDPDSEAIAFTLLTGAPAGDTVTGSAYSFAPGSADTGVFYPQIVAHDPQGASDTLTITLTVSILDTTPPSLRIHTPVNDSMSTNANSVTVRAIATDASGIALVTCAMGPDSFIVTKSADTVFAATVTGLVQDQFNTITFVAIDSSPVANRCTLFVHIKYDPTMLDSAGPAIIQKLGPASGSVITGPVIAITDSILDPSGIDSVFWTLNGTWAGAMTLVNGSTTNFTLRDTLTAFHANRVVVHAIDNSTRRNRDSAVVALDYNARPLWLHRILSKNTNEEQPISLSLSDSCTNLDSDSLTFSILTGPGSITEEVWSWTPTFGDSGLITIRIRVTDDVFSDTMAVNLRVGNVNRAPVWKNKSFSMTINEGQTYTLALSDTCYDPDNDQLTFNILPGSPVNDTINAQKQYTFASMYSDSGLYTVKIVASDGSLNDSLSIFLLVTDVPLYTLSTPASTGGMISTTPSSPAINENQYMTGTVITLTANPASGYVFRKWSIDVAGENPTTQVTMTKDMTANAFFILNQESTNIGGCGTTLTPGNNYIFKAGGCSEGTVTRYNADNLLDTFNVDVLPYAFYNGAYSEKTKQYYITNNIGTENAIYAIPSDSTKTFVRTVISAPTTIEYPNWGATKIAIDQNHLYMLMGDPNHYVIIQVKIPEIAVVKEVTISDMREIRSIIADTNYLYLAGIDTTGIPIICKKDKINFQTLSSIQLSIDTTNYPSSLVLFSNELWFKLANSTSLFGIDLNFSNTKELIPSGTDVFSKELGVANNQLWCGKFLINATTLSYKSYGIFTETPAFAGRRYLWCFGDVYALDKSLIQ
jgi:hypothetical protein